MQLVQLNINGNNIDFLDQPDGLDKIQIGYDRDVPYNGFKVEAKVTLTFYCGSGYNALKAEYERAFVDGVGYLVISETCNNIETAFTFKLDFSKYKQTTETIQIGLVEDNAVGNLKDLLEVEKEIPEGDAEDVYIRNIDVRYLYHANKSIVRESPYNYYNNPYAMYWNNYNPNNFIFTLGNAVNPKTETTINELETGYVLTEETVTFLGTNDLISITSGERVFVDPNTPPFIFSPVGIDVQAMEPQEIFRNELENGLIKIETNGSTALAISSIAGINFLGNLLNFKETIIIGKTYENPKYTKQVVLSGDVIKTQNPLATGLTNIPLTNSTTPFYNNVIEFPIEQGDSVWIQYSYDLQYISITPEVVSFNQSNPNSPSTVFTPNTQKDILINYVSSIDGDTWIWDPNIPNPFPLPNGQYKEQARPFISGLVWEYNDIGIDINRTIDIEFVTNQNTTTNVFNNMGDVEQFSTKVSAYKASTIANELFVGIDYNELDEPKYNDLYLTRGDILRNKAGRDKFRLTASKFFDNLEKMTGLGLGIFYDNSLNSSYRLATIEDFYTDNIFKTYSLEYDDVTLTIAENMLYKSIEIGYGDFKDSFDELHGRNIYQIEGVQKGKAIYQKVCEWIASKFIFKRAFNLGSSSEGQEYDNSLFVISLDSNKATISDNRNTATIGKDLVYEQNQTNERGLNRKYSSLYNLKRHEYKWGFGIYKGKTDLSTEKNVNNIKEISYNDGIGYINLPNFVKASNDITVNDIDVQDDYVPHYIEFSVPMNITEFSNLRKNWYDTIQVNVDADTYFGNIVSADWSEGVCKYKLIGKIL